MADVREWPGVDWLVQVLRETDPGPSPPMEIKQMLKITLSDEDHARAMRVGTARQQRRESAGHQNAHGSTGDGDDHVLGAMGECAYSRLSGRPWTGAAQDIGDDSDVDGVQVRTRRSHDYDLYLWPNDKRDAWWVLMTGTSTFVYQGKIWGEEACSEEFFVEANPNGFPRTACYVIPKSRLDPSL